LKFLLQVYKYFIVEKIFKGSLDSIPSPSPSVKVQLMGGKVCLRCTGKTFLGIVNKVLKTKSLSTSHFLYRILDSKKTSRFQFSAPGLREIHRNLKQQKISILAMAFLENPLFVLFSA
jgi:hypothetical protein